MAGLYIDDSGNKVQVSELALIAGKQQMVLGNLERDLILRTAGNVQIQVGNKFYPLTFNTTVTGSTTTSVITSTTTILATPDLLTTLTYPGDGNYVFVLSDKSFYIASNGSYVRLNAATTSTGTPIVYLSYSSVQSLTGDQKLQVALNAGLTISQLSDVSGLTTSDVYVNQVIYSANEKKHYVLTNSNAPNITSNWRPLYLSLLDGGVVQAPVTINLTGQTKALSALHIEGLASLTDVRNLTTSQPIFTLGKSDYSTGLAVWSNGTTYFQNLLNSSTAGFKFLASTLSGTLTTPLTLYPQSVGIMGVPDTAYALTVTGTSKFTDTIAPIKGLQSPDFIDGTTGTGFTLSKDPLDNKWLLEVDKVFIRDQTTKADTFYSKSINGSFLSNPSITISAVQYIDNYNVYTLASQSGNYSDTSGTVIPLSSKQQYALVDSPSVPSEPGSPRSVILTQLDFGFGDRNSSGTPASATTYIKDLTSAYVSVPATHVYDGTSFTAAAGGTYVLSQSISIYSVQTASIAMVAVGDLLYYVSWNPDGTEDLVLAATVTGITDNNILLNVYNSGILTNGQELMIVGRTTSNNSISINGIEQNGDYVESLSNVSSFRDIFSNFYYSPENYEQLPVNTYKPLTSKTISKFGAINNIVDSDLGLTGTPNVGLYSSNAYLKGNFVLNKAIFTSVPTVTSFENFIMLHSDNTLEQVDMSAKFAYWNAKADNTITILATGNGITGGGDLTANRTISLDFVYLDSRYGTHTYISLEAPGGSINGTNTSFALAKPPVLNSETVYLNGLVQIRGIDYTISSTTITFAIAPYSGDSIAVTYLDSSSSSVYNYASLETPAGSINGTNVTFTLAALPKSNSEMVILNGLIQQRSIDYSMTGNTITMTVAPYVGDYLSVTYTY